MTADLTPVGPYRSGQTVLLVVDVTNVGARQLKRLVVSNQATNLVVQPLWGGCDNAPCPPFTLASLRQKQVTLPATITDAGQPIADVVTVSGGGITRQVVVRIAPPPPKPNPNPWPYILGGAAAVALGGAGAAWGAQRWRQAQLKRWQACISAKGALGAAQEATVGDVKFAAPPVSVRVRMDPGETRFAGPIALYQAPASSSPESAPPEGGPPESGPSESGPAERTP